MCTGLLPPGVNAIAVNKYIIISSVRLLLVIDVDKCLSFVIPTSSRNFEDEMSAYLTLSEVE
jgi:hypothetical protein